MESETGLLSFLSKLVMTFRISSPHPFFSIACGLANIRISVLVYSNNLQNSNTDFNLDRWTARFGDVVQTLQYSLSTFGIGKPAKIPTGIWKQSFVPTSTAGLRANKATPYSILISPPTLKKTLLPFTSDLASTFLNSYLIVLGYI